MKILLINPPVQKIGYPWYVPPGLSYIAAMLVKFKYDTEIMDVNAHRYPNKTVIKKIKNNPPDIFAITAMINSAGYVSWITNRLKKEFPDKKIILGGTITSMTPKTLFKYSGVDIQILGEGEQTIIDLLQTLEKKGDLKNVDGIIYKENNKIITTAPRKQIEDINTIPFPAYDLFPMEIYLSNRPPKELELGGKILGLTTSRGCPYQCIFCFKPFYGIRLRSAENIFEEVKMLKEKYKITGLHIFDDCAIFPIKRMERFCDLLLKNKMNLQWVCMGRINLMTEKLLRKMKKAGCRRIQYGIESGSNKILKIIGKGFTIEQAEETINLTRKVGIIINATFIFGLPGEDEKTMQETIDFIKKMDLEINKIFFPIPYPGTRLYKMALEQGKIVDEEATISKMKGLAEFCINFTKWSDEELIKKREQMESIVKKHYYKKHPIKYLRLFKPIIIWRAVKHMGLIKTTKIAYSRIKSNIKMWRTK